MNALKPIRNLFECIDETIITELAEPMFPPPPLPARKQNPHSYKNEEIAFRAACQEYTKVAEECQKCKRNVESLADKRDQKKSTKWGAIKEDVKLKYGRAETKLRAAKVELEEKKTELALALRTRGDAKKILEASVRRFTEFEENETKQQIDMKKQLEEAKTEQFEREQSIKKSRAEKKEREARQKREAIAEKKKRAAEFERRMLVLRGK